MGPPHGVGLPIIGGISAGRILPVQHCFLFFSFLRCDSFHIFFTLFDCGQRSVCFVPVVEISGIYFCDRRDTFYFRRHHRLSFQFAKPFSSRGMATVDDPMLGTPSQITILEKFPHFYARAHLCFAGRVAGDLFILIGPARDRWSLD